MRPQTLSDIDWTVFKPHKYYVHVYQTKIERSWKDLRTLHSRAMARYLSQNWNSQYWPRPIDASLIEGEDIATARKRHYSRPHRRNERIGQLRSEVSTSRTALSSNMNTSFRRRRRVERFFSRTKNNNYPTEDVYNSETTDKYTKNPRDRNNLSWTRSYKQEKIRARGRERRRDRESTIRKNPERRTSSSNGFRALREALQRVSRDVNLLKVKIDQN